MARRRILWQLYPSYLVVTVASVIAIYWLASSSFRSLYVERTISDLEARAAIMQSLIVSHMTPADTASLSSLCRDLADRTKTQITIADVSGRVLADSRGSSADSDLRGLAEFTDALSGRTGIAERLNLSDGAQHLYVSAPVRSGNEIVGVIRMSYPIATIDDALGRLRITVGVAVIVIAVLAALLSLFVARRISRPLEDMKRGADRYAAGELEPRLGVPDSAELGSLANAINHMAAELHDRIHTAIKQRNEQEAILSSMTEGILVVDTEDRLLNVNQAAAELFEIDQSEIRGQLLQQTVRNPALQNIVAQILSTWQPVSGEVILYQGAERYLQVQGNVLRGNRGEVTGAIIVLHDVTRIRKLENIRRDFVANVSHELKTPVTSIKGYVETLLDGHHSQEDSQRFLEIIMRQADRLNAIIDDLLSLSRIETDAEQVDLALEEQNLASVVRNSLLGMEKTAHDKQVSLQVDCDKSITAQINAPLLEQAIVNLVDNAVKYSSVGSTVTISVGQSPIETIIAVADNGCGIASEYLPRLFERFFRVDKSRSREVGGTGLGLAIVKHIVLAHGGTVSVASEIGKGSTFSIHLPRLKTGHVSNHSALV